MAEQARRTPANLKEILEAVGASLEDVVKCSVFSADTCDFAAMNAE